MIFKDTALRGVFLVEPERLEDARGFFMRTFCREEFRAHGIDFPVAQANVSFNPRKGTLRGLHYQAEPHGEAKVVSCTRGSLFDVLVDLRRDSPTFRQHVAEVLSAANRRMFCAPKGVAHGFLSLEDDTEVSYLMSEPYHPASGRGVRWDDPAFGIRWPGPVKVISDKDRSYPDFT